MENYRQSLSRVFGLVFLFLSALSLFFSYLFPLHLEPWTTFYNEWLMALFIGFLGVLVFFSGRISVGNPIPWVVLFFGLMFNFVFFDGGGSFQFTSAFIFTIFFLVGWLAYVLGVNLGCNNGLSAVLFVVWLSAMVSAIVAFLQWSGIVKGANWGAEFILYSPGGGRVYSNIGQANNLGTLLVLGMAVVGFFWYKNERKTFIWRILAGISMFMLALGVYFSGSRTASLNLILWPVLFFVWARWRRQEWPWLALLPVALLGMLQLFMPLIIEWWGLFPVQEARSLVSDGNRPRLWLMVLKAIGEQPWFGHGFGAVANAHLRLSPEFGSFDLTIAHQAHNSVLDMWLIFGLPLGTLVVAGVIWIWIQAWRESQTIAKQFIWMMSTSMLVHAMLEFPLHYGFFFWLLCLLLGALGGKEWKVLNIQHSVAASMVWLMVFMAVAIPVWHAYVQTESLYSAYRQRGPEATHRLLKELPPTLGQVLYPEPYERLRWATLPMDDVFALNDEGLAALERQASRYPLPTLGWRMAFAQAARGNVEQATWWAERMCRMFDPRVCASAADEWKRRGAESPKWPALPWEKWLPANAVKP